MIPFLPSCLDGWEYGNVVLGAFRNKSYEEGGWEGWDGICQMFRAEQNTTRQLSSPEVDILDLFNRDVCG